MFERRIALFTFRCSATSGARWLLLALALTSLLALRPVCLAQAALPAHAFAAHDHAAHAASGVPGDHHEPECCAAHAGALPVNVGDAATSFVKDGSGAALTRATPVHFFVAQTLLAPRSRSARGALERIRSYHARSARMLR